MQQMQDLSDARRRVQYTMVEQLAAMNDPRYAGMEKKDRLLHVGYSPEEAEGLIRIEQDYLGGGSKDESTGEDELSPITVDPSRRRNPNAIDPDEIIQRPSGRRRRPKPAARALIFDTPGGRGGFGDPEAREGKFFENLFEGFRSDAAEDRRRLMETQFERRDKGSP